MPWTLSSRLLQGTAGTVGKLSSRNWTEPMLSALLASALSIQCFKTVSVSKYLGWMPNRFCHNMSIAHSHLLHFKEACLRHCADLVFLQNGMLEPWLESRGLAHATQLLVYFAVAKSGDDPIDGKTDVNPEGLTAVSGKWGEAVATRLHTAGLSCKVGTSSDSCWHCCLWSPYLSTAGACSGLVSCRLNRQCRGMVRGEWRGEGQSVPCRCATASNLN